MIVRKLLIFILLVFYISASAQTQKGGENSSSENFKLSGIAEIGYLGVIDHKIQFSNSGTYFDYKKDGGQDVLFPVSRYSLELKLKERNTIILLYQPLRLGTQVLLQDDLIVDDLSFPASSGIKLLYDFPFYRISYLRELIKNSKSFKLAIGVSLQIRNATISFESNDGNLFRTNRDVGPVPVLKMRTSKNFGERYYLELEADGMYAPISYLNGSDNEVVGAILDASLRTGIKLNESVNSFFNLRYISGGSVGTSEDNDRVGDGYLRNWLDFYTVSVGFKYNL